MAKQPKKYLWKIDKFFGESNDPRIGPPGSAETMIGFEVNEDSGVLQLAGKPVKHSSTTITKLVKWIEYVQSVDKSYAYAENTIYEEDGGAYTAEHTIASGTPNGEGLCEFDGYLYYRTGTQLGRYDLASTWTDNWQTGLEDLSSVGFGPLMRFKNLMIGGNGRYLMTVDDVGTFDADRLTFPPGFNVRDIAKVGSYAVIALMRGTDIENSNEGYIALWDGTSQTYNELIPIDGNPHCVIARNNMIYIITGSRPVIQKSLGGTAVNVFRIPGVPVGKTAEVYPGAKDIWNKKFYFGISAGTSTDIARVVRSWGSKDANIPEHCNAEFPTSQADLSAGTGYTGTGVQITAVKRVGTTLRFAWKNGSDYGIDEVDTTQLQAYGLYRSLAFDRESPYEKLPDHTLIELIDPLAENESVRVRMSVDPYGDPSFADSTKYVEKEETTANKKLVRLPMVNSSVKMRSRDLKLELLIGGTAATKPKVKRIWTILGEDQETI